MIRVFSQDVSVKSLLLLAAESGVIVVSLVLGAWLRFWDDPGQFSLYANSGGFLLQIFTVLVVLETCCYYNDLYDLSIVRPRGELILSLAQALGAGCLLLGLLYFLFPGLLVGRGVLFIALALIVVFVGAMRSGVDWVWQLTTREKVVLILGDGETAMTAARELERRVDLNFRIAGFVAPERNGTQQVLQYPVLGDQRDLRSIAVDHGISKIIVALEDFRGALPARDLVRLKVQGIEIEDAPSALAALTGRVWLRMVRPSWFVFASGFQRSRVTLLIKRIIDLAVGLFGIVFFSPIIGLAAIAIRLDSKGEILYRQERVGYTGKTFNLLKFRSMHVDAERDTGAQWATREDPRITRVGRVLRKYRLDELPQFLNVIRGEMSFVGPRPERPCFVEQLREQIPFYDERHSVRPGITGWAQVEYQYAATIEDAYRKLEYDLFYLKNLSIWFDIAIVVRTVRVVLFGSGW
jgi:sugar transferase (PEP-CTERM system associated)